MNFISFLTFNWSMPSLVFRVADCFFHTCVCLIERQVTSLWLPHNIPFYLLSWSPLPTQKSWRQHNSFRSVDRFPPRWFHCLGTSQSSRKRRFRYGTKKLSFYIVREINCSRTFVLLVELSLKVLSFMKLKW